MHPELRTARLTTGCQVRKLLVFTLSSLCSERIGAVFFLVRTALDGETAPDIDGSGRLLCSSWWKVMDRMLEGGLVGRGITEIVGESATAKTQVCLQLAITVQLPLADGGWLNTFKNFIKPSHLCNDVCITAIVRTKTLVVHWKRTPQPATRTKTNRLLYCGIY
jgi:hypothetical protein